MDYFMHYLLFFLIYFICFFPIWDKNTQDKLHIHSLMFTYIILVLTITIVPLPTMLHFQHSDLLKSINILPFRDLIHGYAFAKRELILNILMTIPFGVLFPILSNKKGLATLLATMLFSLMIEMTQILTILFYTEYPRVVDITDLITNTTGGLIGYIGLMTFNFTWSKFYRI